MRYLLDTNIISALIRDPDGPVAEHIREAGETNVYTSIIVAAELHFGVAHSGSARLAARLAGALARIEALPLQAPADAIYGELRARLRRIGNQIGGNDLMIASHALALGHTLVTDNGREFSRIAELPIENWLR